MPMTDIVIGQTASQPFHPDSLMPNATRGTGSFPGSQGPAPVTTKPSPLDHQHRSFLSPLPHAVRSRDTQNLP